jgi:hypothetical protein
MNEQGKSEKHQNVHGVALAANGASKRSSFKKNDDPEKG